MIGARRGEFVYSVLSSTFSGAHAVRMDRKRSPGLRRKIDAEPGPGPVKAAVPVIRVTPVHRPAQQL